MHVHRNLGTIKNNRGSALIQAMMLVSMVGLVSVGLGEYSRYSSSSLNHAKSESSKIGVGELVAGVFKSASYCLPANVDLQVDGGAPNDNLLDVAGMNAAILARTQFPIQVRLPFYDNSVATIPSTDPANDQMMNEYNVAVSSLNIRFTREINSGASYEAEITAGFVTRRGLNSTTLAQAGTKRIATVVMNRGVGNLFQSCVTQGTAADFCETSLGCTYLISTDVNGVTSEACMCGVQDATCGANQILTGFDAAGVAQCAAYPSTPGSNICPSGQYVVKINADGTPDCRVWPFTPCIVPPNSGLAWTNAGSGTGPNCTNDFQIQIPPGSEVRVGDLGSAFDTTSVGRAYFRCPYGSTTAILVPHSLTSPQECYLAATPTPTPTPTSVPPTSTPIPTAVPTPFVDCTGCQNMYWFDAAIGDSICSATSTCDAFTNVNSGECVSTTCGINNLGTVGCDVSCGSGPPPPIPTGVTTTMAPTTMAPTTMAPTTMAPTTMAPTTMAPTTMAPTTTAPAPNCNCITVQPANICVPEWVYNGQPDDGCNNGCGSYSPGIFEGDPCS